MKDAFGNDLISCYTCGEPARLTQVRQCDRCWSIECVIRRDFDIAEKIYQRLKYEKVVQCHQNTSSIPVQK